MVALLLLGGCALDPFEPYPYQPPGPRYSAEGPQAVGVGTVAAQIGTPAGSIAQVAATFRGALAARSLLASGDPRYVLVVTVQRYDVTPAPAESAEADLRMALTDRTTGTVAYTDEVDVRNTEGRVFALDSGAAATPGDRRHLAARTLAQAVDQAIDKVAFRTVLARARPPLLDQLVTPE